MYALYSGASNEMVVKLLISKNRGLWAKEEVPFYLSCVLTNCDRVFMALFGHLAAIALFPVA
jgi:hypothetical protein